MLCVTGAETSLEAWNQRVALADERCLAAGLARPLHELRMDTLHAIDDATFDAVRRRRAQTIVCCRPKAQGGHFGGTERERLAILRRAAAAGPAWLDAEADLERTELATLRSTLGSGTPGTDGKLIVSWHEFSVGTSDLVARVALMAALGADLLKVAVQVEDAAELGPLLAAFDGLTLPRVVLGMGAAGIVTRSHYRAFGSAFTYVSASDALATAPGQFDLETAIALGLPDSANAPMYGLCGGAQIVASPGPRVFNRYFRAHGLPSSYVPIVTRSLARTLPVLESLGAVGLSVTMPLKLEALTLSVADDLADEVGAVNSLRRRTRWEGTNTDVLGIRGPLSMHGAPLGLERAVILGSGGAARAALRACRDLGYDVHLHARSLDLAQAVAAGAAHVHSWASRGHAVSLARAVLINATPISGTDNPWPDDQPLDSPLVFDTALGEEPSSLLERAKTSGAVTLGPLAMWFSQAAAQLAWMLDVRVTSEELEGLYP